MSVALQNFKEMRNTHLPVDLIKSLVAADGVGLSPTSSLFAKFLTGLATAPYEIEKTPDGEFAFFKNRPDNDIHWESTDPEWIGRASMSAFHRFIVPTDMSDWRLFNAVTLPSSAVPMLKRARGRAHEYAAKHGVTNPGLYLHCYPHNSINMLHIHIVDLDRIGPTFDALAYKNLSLDECIKYLQLI